MEKKYQKIYIWSFIIISSLILILMYTPIGGNLHDSTYGNSSYSGYVSVDFGDKINNAPHRSSNSSNNQPTNVPIYQPQTNTGMSAANMSTSSSNTLSNNSGSQANLFSSKSGSFSNGVSSAGGGGGAIALGGSKGAGSGGGITTSGGGMFNSGSDNFTGVMQKSPQDGLTLGDPGGEENLGDPLPVGDGFWILIILSVIYASMRGFFVRQQ